MRAVTAPALFCNDELGVTNVSGTGLFGKMARALHDLVISATTIRTATARNENARGRNIVRVNFFIAWLQLTIGYRNFLPLWLVTCPIQFRGLSSLLL